MKEPKSGYKFGYKVVKGFDGNGYWSCVSPMRVNYWLKHWTEQPDNCGPLAVFETEMQAQSFIQNNGIYAYILRCKYLPSKQRSLYAPNCGHKDRWGVPPGTKFAKAVKLIREVRDDIELALAA